MNAIDLYLEAGEKRVFACALAWPGWARSGRDEASAVQALLDSAPRYAAILHANSVDFSPPINLDDFHIIGRLPGNSTTNFGAPDAVPPGDAEAMSDPDLARAKLLLAAYWQAFDGAVEEARGKPLRKGPRGGGRDLEGVVQHVIGADTSYLRRLSYSLKRQPEISQDEQMTLLRQAEIDALDSAQRCDLPTSGPRGGKIWPPRYFVRRSGWHTLDHVWEIEDRVMLDFS